MRRMRPSCVRPSSTIARRPVLTVNTDGSHCRNGSVHTATLRRSPRPAFCLRLTTANGQTQIGLEAATRPRSSSSRIGGHHPLCGARRGVQYIGVGQTATTWISSISSWIFSLGGVCVQGARASLRVPGASTSCIRGFRSRFVSGSRARQRSDGQAGISPRSHAVPHLSRERCEVLRNDEQR